MDRRSRHTLRPEVARLETRDVPTVVSPLAFGGAGLAAERANAAANAKLAGFTLSVTAVISIVLMTIVNFVIPA